MILFQKLYAWMWGTYKGQDMFGNTYYCRITSSGEKRWVLYRGLQEASKVPAEWHGWLHKTCDQPLDLNRRYPWQKLHVPNLSGTSLRVQTGDSRVKKGLGYSSSYQPWNP